MSISLPLPQVPFVEVNLDHYPDRRYEMQEKTGRRTVPQIFFNSRHIGGFDDLKKLVRELLQFTLIKADVALPCYGVTQIN